MIIGFSRYGEGGSGPALDYLTGYLVNGEARAAKPEIVRGNPAVVGAIIDALPFQRRYTSGVLSFAAEDRVTPEIQSDIIARFEDAVFAGLSPDRRSIVWIKHTDKGRTELHFVVPRVDLGTGKSLNIAPPTPASRHLLDTLREAINRRHGFRDPTDPERARAASLPAHVAKLAAQARRLGRSAKPDIRQAIAGRLEAEVRSGTIQNRSQMVAFLQQHGFRVTRAGLNYLTVQHPGTGERVRLKGTLFHEHFCPADLRPTVAFRDPARLLALERRLERLVAKRASYHRARFNLELPAEVRTPPLEPPIYDRLGNPTARRLQTIGGRIPAARSQVGEYAGRFVEATHRWCEADRDLELATRRLGRAHRAFAECLEPALTVPGPDSQRVVVPGVWPASRSAPFPLTLHERDLDFEPELEVEFP
jgi:hypothetical protein